MGIALDPNDPCGWRLAPCGAAVHLGVRAAVIADVHLGYEWARGACGDVVPAHSLQETLRKLQDLLQSVSLKRLVVAGDLVESRRVCAATERDVARLRRWLAGRGVELVELAGNHDPPAAASRAEALELGGWVIVHGHRPTKAPRAMMGHHHPIFRLNGVAAPCFLAGPRRVVLPAFSTNAAGLNVLRARMPAELDAQSARCVAALGDELFDFGPLATLHARLRRARKARQPPCEH
jgi:hypothetical protein